MKKRQPSWRNGQTYAERQKAYAEKYRIPALTSHSETSFDAIRSSIQVSKVPERHGPAVHNFPPTRGHPQWPDTEAEPRMSHPEAPNPRTLSKSGGGGITTPLRIPFKDIRLQITSRADAECPRPPPNTPPKRAMRYDCGDFTYDIPLEDHFSTELFQRPNTVCKGDQSEDEYERETDEAGTRGHELAGNGQSVSAANRHSQSSVSLPSPKGSEEERLTAKVVLANVDPSRCEPVHDRSILVKPPSGNGFRVSQTVTTKGDSGTLGTSNRNPILPGRWSSLRVMTLQSSTMPVTQKHEGFSSMKSVSRLRKAGGSQSHADLDFVHNPRIARFLEEIKAAKEKKEAAKCQSTQL